MQKALNRRLTPTGALDEVGACPAPTAAPLPPVQVLGRNPAARAGRAGELAAALGSQAAWGTAGAQLPGSRLCAARAARSAHARAPPRNLRRARADGPGLPGRTCRGARAGRGAALGERAYHATLGVRAHATAGDRPIYPLPGPRGTLFQLAGAALPTPLRTSTWLQLSPGAGSAPTPLYPKPPLLGAARWPRADSRLPPAAPAGASCGVRGALREDCGGRPAAHQPLRDAAVGGAA